MQTKLLAAGLALALITLISLSFKPADKPEFTESCSIKTQMSTMGKSSDLIITEKNGTISQQTLVHKETNVEAVFQQQISKKLEEGWTLHTVTFHINGIYAVLLR